MNRYTFAAFGFLLTTLMYVPVARGETASNATVIRSNRIQLTPFTLVSLAYQGHYRSQGIRGYSGMFADSNDGRISAKKLVQAAVNAGELPAQTLNDRGFINAVDANLDALEIPNTQ
ncbi:hypothetical protein [Chroogloeocystis siderophila]|jgi:hypothetical protein|uniref:Uncharacterized protein n=1 Tax=Chroogloeocystis siderophila 5.2 s.c.1 TaxID=247279 RepID=A0A1U7HVY0_9CHRO|nr:hypothetical protein [Chroogloeocystis siderophila]OKH27771.1 hypothetical protein NIES1031_07605 [Chroogloeocystis siderophila 5.2 s.c.1]